MTTVIIAINCCVFCDRCVPLTRREAKRTHVDFLSRLHTRRTRELSTNNNNIIGPTKEQDMEQKWRSVEELMLVRSRTTSRFTGSPHEVRVTTFGSIITRSLLLLLLPKRPCSCSDRLIASCSFMLSSVFQTCLNNNAFTIMPGTTRLGVRGERRGLQDT